MRRRTIKIDGHSCKYELADGGYDEEEYRYVVIAPDGYRFTGHQTHTMAVYHLESPRNGKPLGRVATDYSLEKDPA